MAVDTLTLSEIQSRVNTVVRDPSKVFVTDANVQDWVNEAQLDLAGRYRSFLSVVSGNVAADSVVDLPTTFLELRRLRLGTTAPFDRVEIVSDDVFDSFEDRGATPMHTIGRFFFTGIVTAIELYPIQPTTVEWIMRFYGAPDDMTGASDVSPLPARLHVKLVQYAQAQACIKIREVEQAASYMGMYEQGLPPPPGAVQPTQNVPKQMHYERGPFDHSEARHL
jgi:hypothetical protein